MTRNKAIQTAASTLPPTFQSRNVLPSSYLKASVFEIATNSSAARIAYANLYRTRVSLIHETKVAYDLPVHPAHSKANPAIEISARKFHYWGIDRHQGGHFT
jgi:hypothetical protein